MAKAALPKVPISARVAPELAADIEAIETQEGKTKTEVIEDLIRAALDARKGAGAKTDPSAKVLAQVLAAIEGMMSRPAPDTSSAVATQVASLKVECETLCNEVSDQQRRVVELVHDDAEAVKREVAALKNGLGVVLVTVLGRLFPHLPKEEVRQMVKKSFES